MSASLPDGRLSLPVRVAIGLAAGGGLAMAVGVLVAFLVADHSSSDSSVSSVVAVLFGSVGLLCVLLGALLFAGIAVVRAGRLIRGARRRSQP